MREEPSRRTDEFFRSTSDDGHDAAPDGDEARLARRALDHIIQGARQRFGETLATMDSISTFRPIAGWREARRIRRQVAELDAMYIAALNAIIERAEHGMVGAGAGAQALIVPKVTTKATAQIAVMSGEWRAVHDAVNRLEATAIAMVAFYISIVSFLVSLATPFLLVG
jgi:hypothetical protein